MLNKDCRLLLSAVQKYGSTSEQPGLHRGVRHTRERGTAVNLWMNSVPTHLWQCLSAYAYPIYTIEDNQKRLTRHSNDHNSQPGATHTKKSQAKRRRYVPAEAITASLGICDKRNRTGSLLEPEKRQSRRSNHQQPFACAFVAVKQAR